MNAIVIKHVKVSDLPELWRAQLLAQPAAQVTVRIEEETLRGGDVAVEGFVTDDPAFGIWRDRQDLADMEAYMRVLRAPRYHRNGSRKGD